MRRVVLLALLALAIPLAASASSIDVTNVGGTITGNASGLSLSGSTIIQYGGIVGTNLGSVTFTTGAFTSGNATTGGTLGAGGSFTITGNGTNGVPNGVIFTGTFDKGATWTVIGNHYVLTGTVTGSGSTDAVIVQLSMPGKLNPNGTITLSSGDISITSVPEPGTLGLLGTGLLGIGGLLRRKRMNG